MTLLQTAAVEIARGAGAILKRCYYETTSVTHKGMIDLVSSADLESEAYVKSEIQKRFSEHAILAEESGATMSAHATHRWIIDPLDGTVNFVHRIPHFCVLIAVQEKHGETWRTQVGVTLDPLRDELFVAARGAPPTLNDRPITVSRTSDLLQSAGATGFGYNRLFQTHDNHAEFCRMNLITQGVRRMGSAGLDLAYVACGRLDFYWENGLNPWDYAAGAFLVQQAGGTATDMQGSDIDLKAPRSPILASNGALHTRIVPALASAAAHPANAREGLASFLPADVAARLENTRE